MFPKVRLCFDNIRYKRYNGKGKIGNTRLYTGREYDNEVGLYYNRARYYNPDLGRFISRDPIDISDDVNLYAYVGNNSVMFVDRMGLSEKPVVEESTVSKIVSSFFDPNLLPINELEKLSQEADSFTVVRTTMLNPENQVGPKVHTEIIFFTGDDPIASLGSAMIFGWKLEKNQDVLDTYVEHGTLVGIRKSDVEGCVEGLEDSLSSSMWTLEGRATICWHGPISCYNNSENEYGKESNILVDQIMKYIIPGAH